MYIAAPGTTISLMLPFTLPSSDASGGFPLADATFEAVARDSYSATGYAAEFTVAADSPEGYITLTMEPGESIKLVPGRRYDVSLVATRDDGSAFDLTPACSARIHLYAAPATSDGLGDAIDPDVEGAAPSPEAELAIVAPAAMGRQGGLATLVVHAAGGTPPGIACASGWCRLSAYRASEPGVYSAVFDVLSNDTGWQRTAVVDVGWGAVDAVAHIVQNA